MTDAPLNRPLAPGRHARRPLLLALVRAVFPMVIEGLAVVLGGARQRPLLGRGALSTTVLHDRPGAPVGGRQLQLRGPGSGSPTHGSRDGTGALVERGEILHLNVRLPDATVLLSLGRLEATRGDALRVTAVGDLEQ